MKRIILLIILSVSLVSCNVNSQDKSKLEEVFAFEDNISGYASLCSKNDSLLIRYIRDKGIGGLYWYQDGKIIKNLDIEDFLGYLSISPDGNYYLYVLDEEVYVNDSKDKMIVKIPIQDYIDSVVWSYDSKTFYICEKGDFDQIYSYDITTGIKKEILRSTRENQYLHLVTVKNSNVIYLLENLNDDPSDPFIFCDIVKYDLTKKELTKIVLPKLENFCLTYDFSVSPDEKIILFKNIFDGKENTYVINKKMSKIIDEIPYLNNPGFTSGAIYSWKVDSSYVIFTADFKIIYKYTP